MKKIFFILFLYIGLGLYIHVFGNRYTLDNSSALTLSIDDIPIEQVTKTKQLGVKLDNLLSWSDEIDDILTKMGKGIACARKSIGYVPSNIMADVFSRGGSRFPLLGGLSP